MHTISTPSEHHALFVSKSYPTQADVMHAITSLVPHSSEYELYVVDMLKIDDARSIIERALVSPITNQKKIIAIGFQSATREAKNALLKIIEEPPQGCRFIIVSSSKGSLLPTLSSRLFEIEVAWELLPQDSVKMNGSFFEMPLAQRLEYVSQIEDKKSAHEFLTGLLMHVSASSRRDTRTLMLLERSLRYLSLPSSSLKQILEAVSIVVRK